MTRLRVRFHAAARAEAEGAARWYELRQPGLGDDFVTEIERAVQHIVETPEAWPVAPADPRARHVLLSRFPYSLVYVINAKREVVIAAVAHGKRRPGYWRQRLR